MYPVNAPLSIMEDISPWLRMLVYARPGAGKTIFSCSSRTYNTLLIDVDKGHKSLQTWPSIRRDLIYRWPVNTFEDYTNAVAFAKTNYSKFPVIVVDSASELQKIVMEELRKKTGKPINSLPEWGVSLLGMQETAREFTSIPAHIVWISHETRGHDPDLGRDLFRPSFQGQFVNVASRYFDVVARMLVLEQQDPANPSGPLRVMRLLQTQLDAVSYCKDRINCLDWYEAPDLDTILAKQWQRIQTLVNEAKSQGYAPA